MIHLSNHAMPQKVRHSKPATYANQPKDPHQEPRDITYHAMQTLTKFGGNENTNSHAWLVGIMRRSRAMKRNSKRAQPPM